MISIGIQHNFASFNSTLARYIQATSKSVEDVLEAKGRDLGIRLYRGFSAHRWGRGSSRNLARAELAARRAKGQGTRVRPALLAIYKSERSAFNSSLRSVGQLLRKARTSGTADQISGKFEERSLLRKLRSHLWRNIVGREVDTRQAGIGVLAASFLWFRKRSSQARGTYYQRNRTGQPLGYVHRAAGLFQIVGQTAGLTQVDARYGIVRGALDGAEKDMLVYLDRKARSNLAKLFGGAAA